MVNGNDLEARSWLGVMILSFENFVIQKSFIMLAVEFFV